jgi:hypothetical protein
VGFLSSSVGIVDAVTQGEGCSAAGQALQYVRKTMEGSGVGDQPIQNGIGQKDHGK